MIYVVLWLWIWGMLAIASSTMDVADCSTNVRTFKHVLNQALWPITMPVLFIASLASEIRKEFR